MKHKIGYNRLGRKTAHRKAMTRNMLTSLFRYERIRTTKAKALAVRRTAEKMITRAKSDSVHNRRMIGRDIKDQSVLAKVFTEIGPRFKERPGGYTRVLKLGPRQSDAAEMVILELLGEDEAVKQTTTSKSSKKAAPKKKAPATPKKGKAEEDREEQSAAAADQAADQATPVDQSPDEPASDEPSADRSPAADESSKTD